jgi:hypothetical protein
MLSLFGIDSIGKKIIGKKGVEIFTDLKLSSNEGYTEEGNTLYLQSLISHLYGSEHLTPTMLQTYDENIVRYTKQISENREEQITWKYFQYLSLLFTEVYLDKYFRNKVKLLADLNAYVITFNQKQYELVAKIGSKKAKDVFIASPFTLQSLNKLAFWNATGSGKTLLMHINIKQYLHYANHYDVHHQNKVLLITPNEGLSKQHLAEFKSSNIQASIFNRNTQGGTPGLYSGQEVVTAGKNFVTNSAKPDLLLNTRLPSGRPSMLLQVLKNRRLRKNMPRVFCLTTLINIFMKMVTVKITAFST